MNLKKAGSTKINFTLGGKKHSVKYVVKKYQNPVKAFKIASTNYKDRFAPKALEYGSDYVPVAVHMKSFPGKLVVKPVDEKLCPTISPGAASFPWCPRPVR